MELKHVVANVIDVKYETSNCTNMELKLANALRGNLAYVTSNCTNMELKRYLRLQRGLCRNRFF